MYTGAGNRRSTVLVGLEISAAFDIISHDILINRLDTQFGVRDSARSCLHSYLFSRKQFVKLGQRSSAIMPCDSGVPSDSNLGPLLFTAYMSLVGELIYSFDVSHHHFAEDLQLVVAMDAANTTSALDRLACCSDAVRQWFLENHLQLNADRSDVVILGTSAQLRSAAAVITVDVAGSPLPVASQIKSLGVITDNYLRFDRQTAAVDRQGV